MNSREKPSVFSRFLLTLGGAAGFVAVLALFLQGVDFLTGQKTDTTVIAIQEEQLAHLEALVTINASNPSNETELKQKETQEAEIVGTLQALDATISALQATPALSNEPALTQTRAFPSLSNTPPTSTPEPPNLVFYDDFADGLDPAWQVLSGDWITNKGRAMVQSECGTLLIGEPEWNYLVIDVNYTAYGDHRDDYMRFIFSYQDENNYIGLRSYKNGRLYWDVIRDSSSIEVPDSYVDLGAWDKPHNLIIEIDGNALRGVVDGEPVYDFYFEKPLNGAVGFRTCPESSPHVVEDYKVSVLSP
jgi:hypothetical protein